jgi:antitoxin component YwqK of YwqJK toxin-antitoxin module
MKSTKYIISLAVLVLNISLSVPFQSQANAANENIVQTTCSDCNLRDSQGRKVGLWIEENGLKEIYYKDGLRHGIYKSYYRKNGKLEGLGECENGNKTGTWYYFDEESHLVGIEKGITKNPGLTVKREDGERMTPLFKSYFIRYYPNGVIKEEGIALYDKEIEIDFFKKGTWKYYDQSGKLIKTEEHD